jgi:hypothetical protein
MNEYNDRRLELSSNVPMQVYGDADVLGMMGFGTTYRMEDISEFLGEEFSKIPELFRDI